MVVRAWPRCLPLFSLSLSLFLSLSLSLPTPPHLHVHHALGVGVPLVGGVGGAVVDHGLVDGVGRLARREKKGGEMRGAAWRERAGGGGGTRARPRPLLQPSLHFFSLTLSGKMQVDRQDTSLVTPRLWHSCMMLSCEEEEERDERSERASERGREEGEGVMRSRARAAPAALKRRRKIARLFLSCRSRAPA